MLTQLCWQLAGRCKTNGTRETVGITIAVDAWMATEPVKGREAVGLTRFKPTDDFSINGAIFY